MKIYFLLLISLTSAHQHPLQEPLSLSQHTFSYNLNFTIPSPHLFASTSSLLQQWPNTFFPNGHSIIPCTIPPLTAFYHGRLDADVPSSPEWVAFDIGMAYGIMGGSRNSHMLTFSTTRAIKILYFDGESATLFGTGQLDTQNLHIWGNTTGPSNPKFQFLEAEYARAAGLCGWLEREGLGGVGGYEGIVRMNAGFEMIWCDFTSPSLRLTSHVNVTTPLLPPENDIEPNLDEVKEPLPPPITRTDTTAPSSIPHDPYADTNREPFRASKYWSWFLSGAQHYGSTGDGPGMGEMRVKPVSCGILSYYSPVFRNQAEARAKAERESLNLTAEGFWNAPGDEDRDGALKSLMRRRRSHKLSAITVSEAETMRNASVRVLRDLLSPNPENCTGIDWVLTTSTIVQTYSARLAILLRALKTHEELDGNQTATRNWMAGIRGQMHGFLMGVMEYPDDGEEEGWKREKEVMGKRCKYQATRLLAPGLGFTLGPEENVLKEAVEETLGGICGVLVDVGVSVEGVWEDDFIKRESGSGSGMGSGSGSGSGSGMVKEVKRWTYAVEELMAWLGWAGEWTRCERKCGVGDMCYIPMWPLIGMGGERRPYEGPGYPPYEHPEYPPFERPGYGYGRPGRGSGGGDRWRYDETALWEPVCVKADFITRG